MMITRDLNNGDSRRHVPQGDPRAGAILIITLWILVVLTGMVLVLARSMRVEGACSANYAAAQRAIGIEQGAVQYVLACVDGLEGAVPTEANTPANGVIVGNGLFWIIRPDFDDNTVQGYGIVDEASKININYAGEDVLMMLPRLLGEDAGAIIDWRDSDSSLSSGGAESEYYLTMPDPYQCKNGPLETVEELLLIRGMLPEVLYGEDTNRNGILDKNENDADESYPPDNNDGTLDRGIYDLVTVYSSEPGSGSGGSSSSSQLVDVNNSSSNQLRKVFEASLSANRLEEIVAKTRTLRPFKNVLHFYYRTDLTYDEFKAFANDLTANQPSFGGGGSSTSSVKRGLININTASRDVLLCLPGIGDPEASALLQRRTDQTAEEGIAWVVEALSEERAVEIGSLITSHSYQFSADIVSVSSNGRAFRRCRIVVDARESPPRLVYRRDLTSLGWPLDPDILDALRTGAAMEDVLEATTGLEVR